MCVRLAILTVLLVACSNSFDAADGVGGDDGFGADNAECMVDNDCAAAAAKCCDCPTFALPKSDPTIQACAAAGCPVSTCPTNVAPSCSAQGRCELSCVKMACDNTCADGYAVDDNGCLSCECAQVATRECTDDTSCVEAPADCCGCAQGGADTSVPTDQLMTYEAGLGCSSSPTCPGNDTCVASEAPSCVQGTCALVQPLPANACGRTDLPACASGSSCFINAPNNDPATDHRVGLCL
jgi:Antistasin family